MIDIDEFNAVQYKQMFSGTESVLSACPKCGVVVYKLHRDHTIPRAAGGTNNTNNIQHICANCHAQKTNDDWKQQPEWSSMRGKTHSLETKAKMSASCGHTLSLEHKAKMHTPEAIAKRVAARLAAVEQKKAVSSETM